MAMFHRYLAPLLIAAAPIVANPAQAQTEVTNAADPWVHSQTGTAFPEQLGVFERTQVVNYSADGSDSGVSYITYPGDSMLVATVFLYPMPEDHSCAEMFDRTLLVLDRYEGGERLVEERRPGPAGGDRLTAYYARYRMSAGAVTENLDAADSIAYLHCPSKGDWVVQLFITTPSENGTEAALSYLLGAIEWPAMLVE